MLPESGSILVVDDNENNRDMLQRRLAKAGYTIACAEDGPRALALVAERDFDAVLLDIMMPGMSGLEVLARLRETRPAAELPVIMVTAKGESEDVVGALDAGASDYITKPVDIGVCRARVRTQVALRRATLERKRLADELSARNVQLEQLNQQKNQLLGMAAHDLRNPLAVIRFYSEFLMDESEKTSAEERAQFLVTIRRTSEFMVGLINDILSVAQIESGELKLRLQMVDLPALLERIVKLNGILAASKNISIHLDLPSGVSGVLADEAKIEQVINNLVTNAVKFSHPDTRIVVSLSETQAEVRVAVTDQGQGIPADELASLFRPFQRTSVRSTAGEHSTGLGLAIARRIVEGHRGGIGVESDVGRGSTFWFTLPSSSARDPGAA